MNERYAPTTDLETRVRIRKHAVLSVNFDRKGKLSKIECSVIVCIRFQSTDTRSDVFEFLGTSMTSASRAFDAAVEQALRELPTQEEAEAQAAAERIRYIEDIPGKDAKGTP